MGLKTRGEIPESGVAVELDANGHKKERDGREESLPQPEEQTGGGADGPWDLIHRQEDAAQAHEIEGSDILRRRQHSSYASLLLDSRSPLPVTLASDIAPALGIESSARKAKLSMSGGSGTAEARGFYSCDHCHVAYADGNSTQPIAWEMCRVRVCTFSRQ